MMNNTHHIIFWSTTHSVLGVTPPSEDVTSDTSVNGVKLYPQKSQVLIQP